MSNLVEEWKSQKHSFEVWQDVEGYAAAGTQMRDIGTPDLERMKWYGFFYRKRDSPGRYMNRIRITAGELSAEQAREIAMIAYEFGHGIIDVTTRANLQVQGLGIEHLPKVAARLKNVGLTSKQTGHDNVRNVFAHPFSGVMPGELVDTRQLCRAVTELFVDSREYSDLPRKMNICLNGSGSHTAHFWTQDISYLAAHVDGDVLFQVLLAGTQGQNPHLARHLPVLVSPDQVVEVTRSILDLFRAKGSREKRNQARLRYLVENIGVGGVLEWFEQDLPFRLRPCVSEPVPSASHDELVGWFRQKDPNLWTMGLCVRMGRMTWSQLEGLAVLSRKWGDGQLRTTHEQGIAVINVPSVFKDAAATDAAGIGLSVHADAFDLNTIACTGSQFCNIAVTETKGHMFQLIEKLRKRALKLHGIRIHMSGCPSSCAQHFTADIGLKGVRVRRILGTREGFDLYLGGGIAGRVHMGVPYKLGVDVDQLPTVIEDVVNEFYLKHRAGQTFSSYWREKLSLSEAQKVADEDYQIPVWICEACDHRHVGEDPPVFCPSCAGLRRNFARLEDGSASTPPSNQPDAPDTPRDDGFVFAAKLAEIEEGAGKTVEVLGREYALFRVEGEIRCIDSACPHEGASLAEGELKDGVVVCPWHSWSFDVCTGCSVDPPDNDVQSHEVLAEQGCIYIRPNKTANTSDSSDARRGHKSADGCQKPTQAILTVIEIVQETPDVRTFRIDNSARAIPFDLPGKFAKVCVATEQGDVWRSFTISSSPHDARHLDVTVKLNPAGQVSNHLFQTIGPGDAIKLKGPQGGFCFDPDKHTEPLVLVSAGSGITPMMSIVRYLAATGRDVPTTFLYGARTEADIIFHDECRLLAAKHSWFKYIVTLSRGSASWAGEHGRIDAERLLKLVEPSANFRFFLCGPNDLMDNLRTALVAVGVDENRIHTEKFHPMKAPQTT